MTIEQEFFEAFGIEPTMLCNCSYKNLQEYRYEYGDDNCEHLDDFEFSCKDCEKSKKSIPYYPPITPEIVLKLVEILNREYNILIIECMANSTKITACPAPEQDWGCDEAYYRVCVEEKDLRTAILKVCSDYNVAMSIKTQVRELFNEM